MRNYENWKWTVGVSADNGLPCVDAVCPETGSVFEVCEVWGENDDKEITALSEANAHLIAAAPDGADLAELVMEFCGNPKGLSESQQDELYETALQFMKKARGETS